MRLVDTLFIATAMCDCCVFTGAGTFLIEKPTKFSLSNIHQCQFLTHFSRYITYNYCIYFSMNSIPLKELIWGRIRRSYQGGRVVKALDLRSNVRMHTWVRTPFLVVGPCQTDSFFFSSSFSLSTSFSFSFFFVFFFSLCKYVFCQGFVDFRSATKFELVNGRKASLPNT